MLNLVNVTLRRGQRLLFEEVNLTVYAGQKVGVTGANGVGKSSLFALLQSGLQADAGEVTLPPGTVIAQVAQESAATDKPAIEQVLDGDPELRAVEAELRRAVRGAEGVKQGALHAQLEAIDGYTAKSRAARLMAGLGFSAEVQERPVRTFSGGWRMRLNLAQALMCRSDLLLLDEPTNHLDLDAVLWLEDWLKAYSGTLLLISHDRDFLDRVVDQVLHIEQQGMRLYRGNYSAFERCRAEALAHQQSAYEKQQREIAHIHHFVTRFRAKATKARQAQSRLKALSRLEAIAPAHVDSAFQFSFPAPHKLPNSLMSLEDITLGYGTEPVLKGVGLGLHPGDRLGLLGPNGAGKSTLVKLLAGAPESLLEPLLQPLGGRCERAKDLQIGYFAQHQLEQLRLDLSPLQQLQALDPRATEKHLRNFLGGFGFRGDRVLEAVAPLSGGEKARLVLAMLVYARPNLLLLDEPTNHLDLEMRLALGIALQTFQGAMVLVSHDRHLLRITTDSFLLVADGKVVPFSGDLEDYRRWLAARGKSNANQKVLDSKPAMRGKGQRREAAQQRQRLQPLRQEAQRLEAELERLTKARAAVEVALADSSLYGAEEKERLQAILMEQGRIERGLTTTEDAWIAACEALETAERAAP